MWRLCEYKNRLYCETVMQRKPNKQQKRTTGDGGVGGVGCPFGDLPAVSLHGAPRTGTQNRTSSVMTFCGAWIASSQTATTRAPTYPPPPGYRCAVLQATVSEATHRFWFLSKSALCQMVCRLPAIGGMFLLFGGLDWWLDQPQAQRPFRGACMGRLRERRARDVSDLSPQEQEQKGEQYRQTSPEHIAAPTREWEYR